ncbi:MAG: glycosyl hydrolase family 18 protein [Bacillota bacterium]|nr:glycosyl hydrolase family 18 protein [Bacillota bacterium]
MLIYIVQAGDTLDTIAAAYQTTTARLIADNGLGDPAQLNVGQALLLLFPASTYTVQAGDSLRSIAAAYGSSVRQLLRNNPQLAGEADIVPGQELTLAYTQPRLGELLVNAYCYPNIDRALLRFVLPYLSSLSIFTAGFTSAAELLPLDDAGLVAAARQYRVAPVMVLSPMDGADSFNNALISAVLPEAALRQLLISNILRQLGERGYNGLDLDFEYVAVADREAYSAFAAELGERLRADGYTLNIDLAPKTYDGQPGLLYEGQDYAALGAAADTLLLMTYEYGYTYGPPMAVAPLPEITRVLDYALTRIPAAKLLLGIPNYGYDWPLPYVQGRTRATSISNQRALELAWRYSQAIEFDGQAQAPHFDYTDEQGVVHSVWFEDARSIRAKLELAFDRGIRGVSYWTADRPFTQNWLLLNALAAIAPE